MCGWEANALCLVLTPRRGKGEEIAPEMFSCQSPDVRQNITEAVAIRIDIMGATEQVPEALLNQVVSVFEPRRIILFGSRARGEATEGSDFDLVVVLDDAAPDEHLSSRRRYEAHRGFPSPVDIVPCREGVLRERAKAIGSFAHTIMAEGVVVYERP
jgi:predicted nucleotidyltransferase